MQKEKSYLVQWKTEMHLKCPCPKTVLFSKLWIVFTKRWCGYVEHCEEL